LSETQNRKSILLPCLYYRLIERLLASLGDVEINQSSLQPFQYKCRHMPALEALSRGGILHSWKQANFHILQNTQECSIAIVM